eukprot:scaffold1019_cov338-Pavlova_lutheri.AAC.6
MANPRVYTLVLPREGNRVLLGMKKRGFGTGYWNGFGGKVEPEEGIRQAAHRELREEAEVDVRTMEVVGEITFVFNDQPVPWRVHVFQGKDLIGEPNETEEMRPRWFHTADIPYDCMWPDDKHWYPLFLAGKRFRGKFRFDDTNQIVEHNLEELECIDQLD